MDHQYDVVVVGAGPAGGQCARELAKAGVNVLLIDKQNEIGEPNFSTAGTPEETIVEFGLPRSIIPYEWDNIYIKSKNVVLSKKCNDNFGYVFDFRKLRQWLVEDAAKNGAEISVGTNAVGLVIKKGNVVGLQYEGLDGHGIIDAKIIIDATGSMSCFARQFGIVNSKKSVSAVGMEIQMVNVKTPIKRSLYCYLGDEYVPNGYGWIFPLSNDEVKVGIGRYFFEGVKKIDLHDLLDQFINKVEWLSEGKILEYHAGSLNFDPDVKNFVESGFVSIGTCALHVNALGGEGIRHGMYSGRFAAEVIIDALKGNDFSKKKLSKFNDKWDNYVKNKWKISHRLAKYVYSNTEDARIDDGIDKLNNLSGDDLFDILFNYKFEKNFASLARKVGVGWIKNNLMSKMGFKK